MKKTTFNPLIHNRQSIRLKGYDYRTSGSYFITLNTENRAPLFGEIKNGEMEMNEAGREAYNCWLAIPDHYPFIRIHEFIIMPDHIHGILEIIVGANDYSPRHVEYKSEFKSPSKTIGSVIRGYKIGVTKWMRQNTEIHKVWQRNYYEHIIRDTVAFDNIARYIQDNPKNWRKKSRGE